MSNKVPSFPAGGRQLDSLLEHLAARNSRRSLSRLGVPSPPIPPLDLHALSASELDHQMRRLGGQIRESLNLRQVAGESLDQLLGTQPGRRGPCLRMLRGVLALLVLPFVLPGRLLEVLRNLLAFSHALQLRLVRHEEALVGLREALGEEVREEGAP